MKTKILLGLSAALFLIMLVGFVTSQIVLAQYNQAEMLLMNVKQVEDPWRQHGMQIEHFFVECAPGGEYHVIGGSGTFVSILVVPENKRFVLTDIRNSADDYGPQRTGIYDETYSIPVAAFRNWLYMTYIHLESGVILEPGEYFISHDGTVVQYFTISGYWVDL